MKKSLNSTRPDRKFAHFHTQHRSLWQRARNRVAEPDEHNTAAKSACSQSSDK